MLRVRPSPGPQAHIGGSIATFRSLIDAFVTISKNLKRLNHIPAPAQTAPTGTNVLDADFIDELHGPRRVAIDEPPMLRYCPADAVADTVNLRHLTSLRNR